MQHSNPQHQLKSCVCTAAQDQLHTIKQCRKEVDMQLAEKIFNERKRLGWSQEQLAEHMEVSRQAVSKWESGQSLPDLDKLVLMSQIFGVSTDYLLKEDTSFSENITSTIENNTSMESNSSIEDNFQNHDSFPQSSQGSTQNPTQNTKTARILRSEEIQEYQNVCFKASKAIAFGVTLCIIGVILNLIMEQYSSYGLDTIALLLCVAPAVMLFILSGMKLEKYNYLKTDTFQLAESNRKQLSDEYEKFNHIFMMRITTGVVFCIIAVVAYLVAEAIEKHRHELQINNAEINNSLHFNMGEIPTIVLLLFVAIAVYLFVSSGMRKDCYNVLLQQDGFTTERKTNRNKANPLLGAIAGAYWCLVTAGFLAYSFITGDWGRSWIVWPVAGCIFGAISTVLVFCTEKAKK